MDINSQTYDEYIKDLEMFLNFNGVSMQEDKTIQYKNDCFIIDFNMMHPEEIEYCMEYNKISKVENIINILENNQTLQKKFKLKDGVVSEITK